MLNNKIKKTKFLSNIYVKIKQMNAHIFLEYNTKDFELCVIGTVVVWMLQSFCYNIYIEFFSFDETWTSQTPFNKKLKQLWIYIFITAMFTFSVRLQTAPTPELFFYIKYVKMEFKISFIFHHSMKKHRINCDNRRSSMVSECYRR